jgi:hypothetical protein
MGSALASMPHYLSTGVNRMAANGVEKAVSGLMSMLLLTITGVEELIVFYINMLTSTYLCLITFVVSGSLHVALRVAEDVTNFLQTNLKQIGTDIENDINSFQTDFNKFIGGLNSIPSLFGGGPGAIPTLNVNSSIDQLNNLQLPSGLDEGLQKLNSSIPDFAQVKNFTDNVIRLPFEDVKKLINGSVNFVFDESVFPVPQKEQLTFCSDNDGIVDFFDELYVIADIARKVFLGLLITGAVLACIPMGYMEIRRWRTAKARSKLVTENYKDPIDVVYMISRPYTAQAGMKAAHMFGSNRKQVLTRWVIAYVTSPPALFVLSLAAAGLFSCLCQYILLKSIQKEVPELSNQVEAFADKVVASLNNASAAWSNGTNSVILSTNDEINQNVFGWVNTTTTALNDTLNAFVDEMTSALNATFGGTVLYDPITEVFNCLIGLKIAGIERGLTWVSDHAHVDFPLFPNDTFSAGATKALSDSSSDPGDSPLAAPGSSASDQITAAVLDMTNYIAAGIRTEAIISTTILLIWVVLLLGGIARACFLAARHGKVRGEGGATVAGDIAMQERETADHARPRPMSPSPAYEPPRSATVPGPFAAFREPVPRGTASEDSSEERWQDQKLGFAGERAPTRPGRWAGRTSEYGVVERGEKR